jgi:hypothetical protein
MSRDLAEPAPAYQHGGRLPAAYWTEFENVCLPGRLDRIDLVVVGPSGVPVAAHHPPPAHVAGSTSDVPGDLDEAAHAAVACSRAVAELLPDRYRPVVTAAVRLNGRTAAGLSVGGVFTASPDVLRHAWQHGPRVLSTSEARVVVGLLRVHLRPMPLPPSPRRPGWRRHPRRWLIGAAALAGVAAAVAGGLPTPWGIG